MVKLKNKNSKNCMFISTQKHSEQRTTDKTENRPLSSQAKTQTWPEHDLCYVCHFGLLYVSVWTCSLFCLSFLSADYNMICVQFVILGLLCISERTCSFCVCHSRSTSCLCLLAKKTFSWFRLPFLSTLCLCLLTTICSVFCFMSLLRCERVSVRTCLSFCLSVSADYCLLLRTCFLFQ